MTADADTTEVRVRIAGRVQGVGFRAWTKGKASRLGLAGWVRNLPGGDVEAVFCGSSENVAAMLAACREGPRLAVVAEVRIVENRAVGCSGPFEVH